MAPVSAQRPSTSNWSDDFQVSIKNFLDEMKQEHLQEFADTLTYGNICTNFDQSSRAKLRDVKNARLASVPLGARPPFLVGENLYDDLDQIFPFV